MKNKTLFSPSKCVLNSFSVIILFLGIGCNNNKEQANIIGKWEGVPDNKCFLQTGSGGTEKVEFEFTESGICKIKVTGNNTESDFDMTIDDMAYKLTKDSLILTSEKVKDFRMVYSVRFNKNGIMKLLYKTETCNSFVKLKHVH